jgi:hypothetical protein
VYPPESFEQRRQYGLAIMVTSDARLASYLATVLEALEGWLETGTLQKLVLVIAGTPEGDVLERWTFDVQADKAVVDGGAPPPDKDEAEIMAEIGAVIRQITASVTFLPMLNRPCEFGFFFVWALGGRASARGLWRGAGWMEWWSWWRRKRRAWAHARHSLMPHPSPSQNTTTQAPLTCWCTRTRARKSRWTGRTRTRA